jgi:hypothetical protein
VRYSRTELAAADAVIATLDDLPGALRTLHELT